MSTHFFIYILSFLATPTAGGDSWARESVPQQWPWLLQWQSWIPKPLCHKKTPSFLEITGEIKRKSLFCIKQVSLLMQVQGYLFQGPAFERRRAEITAKVFFNLEILRPKKVNEMWEKDPERGEKKMSNCPTNLVWLCFCCCCLFLFSLLLPFFNIVCI